MQAVQHLFRQILTLLLLLCTALVLVALLLLQRTPLLSETGQLKRCGSAQQPAAIK